MKMKCDNVQCMIICIGAPVAAKPFLEAISQDGCSYDLISSNKPLFLQWLVNNKYFTADVSTCVCSAEQFEQVQDGDLKSLEAVAVLFCSSETSFFEKIKSVTSKINGDKLDVCLLYDTSEEAPENEQQKFLFDWSIENHYELVENHTETEAEEEEGFVEKVGVDRMLEALHSHVWSNHIRKDNETATLQNFSNIKLKDSLDEASLCFQNGASFEEMFGKFEEMKEKAKTLEGDERKEYASKVALAFMEALGIEDED